MPRDKSRVRPQVASFSRLGVQNTPEPVDRTEVTKGISLMVGVGGLVKHGYTR